MPNQEMGGVLIDAAELKHGETQKTGDRAQLCLESNGGREERPDRVISSEQECRRELPAADPVD